MAEDRPNVSRRTFIAGTAAAAAAAACSGSDDQPEASPTPSPEASPSPAPEAPATTPPDPTAAPTTPAPSPTPAPTPTPTPVVAPAPPPTDIASDPFTLGVASGDPTDSSIILWTRLVTGLFENGVPEGDHEVAWELATSDSFSTLVAAGTATAPASLGHSVHVDAQGLRPDTWYAYRFRIGDYTSPTGRTRTFPDPSSSPQRLRIAVSSCQHFQTGYFAAHRHLSQAGLDAFLWLGDYIYERDARRSIFDTRRRHLGGEATTLAEYRARYEQYKRDEDLQAHHAAHPWIVGWDDHEVDGNYANDLSQFDDPRDEFLLRRAAGYQAWYEHVPVRLEPPNGPDLPMYRDLRWGDLAHLFVLDTRQYRDPPPTDGEFIGIGGLTDTVLPLRTLSPQALDPERTMLGVEQETWLTQGLATSEAHWKILASSVVMQGFVTLPGSDPPLVIVDGWDGYSGNRAKLLGAIADAGVTDLVVVSGDLHLSMAGDVRVDPFDLDSPVVAAEFVASAISSSLGRITTRASPTALDANPQMRYIDTRRGYVICEMTPDLCTGIFVTVDNVENRASGVTESARYEVRSGTPGLA